MSASDRISKALSLVLPAGAIGTSMLLAHSAQAATAPRDALIDAAPPSSVADRLQAIRAGMTDLTLRGRDGADLVLAWWGNGGWGAWHPGWGNWHPGWGNAGWHNWGNGGWHNWGNAGWPNWHNAAPTGGNPSWPNWSNGWSNFWHNAAAPGAPPVSAPPSGPSGTAAAPASNSVPPPASKTN